MSRRYELKFLYLIPISLNRGHLMKSTGLPSWSLTLVKSIMDKVQKSDAEIYDHCVRVSRGSAFLAQAAGLSLAEQQIAEYSGLFHDIGKIGITLEVLNKPARLTPAEMNLMKEHPEQSVRLMEPLLRADFFKLCVPGVRHHHEWYDGRGYPHGLKGDLIPLSARVVLIADAFDAMTADRVYRAGCTVEAAYLELDEWAGAQFDPYLVKVFLESHPQWMASEGNKQRLAPAFALKSAA